MTRRPLIAGNWKMNGSKESVALLLQELQQGCEQVEVPELVVFPPFVFLALCEQTLMRTQIAWGAQNVCSEADGPYTGEISATMLRDFHCRYVLVGHSERRQWYRETDDIVTAKLKAACGAGLYPILCVGETASQRKAGQTWDVIKNQLAAVDHLHDNLSALSHWVIAYEPVWAIGTGQHASVEQVQEVHGAIRGWLREQDPQLADMVRILYGGSVKRDNAAALLNISDVDGVLIGGASLHAESFLEIGKLCNHLS